MRLALVIAIMTALRSTMMPVTCASGAVLPARENDQLRLCVLSVAWIVGERRADAQFAES
ncbi:MAG: hypothetical protein OXP75_03900 [Rhodospirillales bacterium]|nr:hypothetical protein [Rhodospirillales bacterium]